MDLIQFQRLVNKEPRYRLEQAKRALFHDLIKNWQEAVVLPLSLREELNKGISIGDSFNRVSRHFPVSMEEIIEFVQELSKNHLARFIMEKK